MTATTHAPGPAGPGGPAGAPGASAGPRRRPLYLLARTELTLFIRERIGPVWGVGFPLLLLVIFGNIPAFRQPVTKGSGLSILDAYLPILVGFVLAMLALNALPMVLAAYRERGVLRRMQTTPVGPARVLAAQLAVNAAVAAAAVVALLAVARIAFGVPLPGRPGAFALAIVLAAAALLAIGLLIAAVAPGGRVAQAIGTLLFFPMMFFAGLWLPIAAMPSVLRYVSHATPLGAAVQALQDSWQGHWPHPLQLLVMAGYAVAAGLAAARLFRWE